MPAGKASRRPESAPGLPCWGSGNRADTMHSFCRPGFAIVVAIAGSSLVAGCATADLGASPSLERRAVERQLPVVAPQSPGPALPPMVSATVRDAVAALTDDARRGDAAFQAALRENRAAALGARNAAVGSEAWATGNVALSRIDAARGPTMVALAELDRLTLDRLDAGALDDAEQLADAQTIVAALAAAQSAALLSLMP